MELWQALTIGMLLLIAVPVQADPIQITDPVPAENQQPCTMTDIWTTVPPMVNVHWDCVWSKIFPQS